MEYKDVYQNKKFTAFTYSCDRYGECCECVLYHHKNDEIPKCFSEQGSKERKEKERFEQEVIDIPCFHPPCIEIFFRCCSVYGKLYLKVHEEYYVGRCPHCKSDLTVPVGSDGPRFGLRQHAFRRSR